MSVEMTVIDLNRQLDVRQRMIDLLDAAGANYHLYHHRPIRNFDDADLARAESGFIGTETKSMVLRSGDQFVVYITLAGNRIDMKAVRQRLGGPKPKFATDAELWEHFAAEPGAAYPFGFDPAVPIYVDPAVFDEEWLLLSAVVSTETVQIHGSSLRQVLARVENPVEEVTDFNQ